MSEKVEELRALLSQEEQNLTKHGRERIKELTKELGSLENGK